MNQTTIEITEQEYLIKLPREAYNLEFIHHLLSRIKSEQFLFNHKSIDEQDLMIKNPDFDHSVRFDDLRDK